MDCANRRIYGSEEMDTKVLRIHSTHRLEKLVETAVKGA